MNCSSISNDVGVSSVTISSWISLLENAYIVRLLPSWSKNPTSRAVKSPKLYFSETGLLVSLARISSPKEIGISSMTGAFFENMVVMEAFKARFNSAAEPRLYFFRDNNGVEVDLIFERSRNVLDLFEVMRFAAMSARKESGDPAALPSSAALMMATVTGAQAQGRSAQCGMLQPGMDADLALVDFSAPHLIPCHNVLNGLVWSAKGGDVAMTMVRGKILYQNGKFPTIDLNHVVQELTEYAMGRLFDEAK